MKRHKEERNDFQHFFFFLIYEKKNITFGKI